jgi:hypothetical protein
MKDILLKMVDAIQQVAFDLACTHIGGQETYGQTVKKLEGIKNMINTADNQNTDDPKK